mmetsp:Transcript_11691/g.33274  ORF Transcript_11691/g.33274 Transcript_11691/m.33274 type:complete len:535 (-) Transcript_11691:154-1758(-)
MRDDGAGHHVDLAGPLRQAVPEALEVGPALLPPGQDDGREMVGQDSATGGMRGGHQAALGANLAGRWRGVQEIGDTADIHHAAARSLVQDHLLERFLRLGGGDRPRPGAVGNHYHPRGVLVRLRSVPVATTGPGTATTTPIDHLNFVVLMTKVRLHQLDAANLQPGLPHAVQVDDPILAGGLGLGPEVVGPVGHLDGKDASLRIFVVAPDAADLEQIEARQQLRPLAGFVVREALPVGLEEALLPLAVPAELLQIPVHQRLDLVVGPHPFFRVIVVVVVVVAGRVALPPTGRRGHDLGPRRARRGLGLLPVGSVGRQSFQRSQELGERAGPSDGTAAACRGRGRGDGTTTTPSAHGAGHRIVVGPGSSPGPGRIPRDGVGGGHPPWTYGRRGLRMPLLLQLLLSHVLLLLGLLMLLLHLKLGLLSLLLGLELLLPDDGRLRGRAGPPLLDQGLLPLEGLDAERHAGGLGLLQVGIAAGAGGAGRGLGGEGRDEGRRRPRVGLDGRRGGQADRWLLGLLLGLLLLCRGIAGRRRR